MENNNQDKRKDNALMQHEKYMKEAIKQAKKAYKLGEVPIGCVIVYEGKIIGRGYNRRKTDKNTLSHAEIIAIRKAAYHRAFYSRIVLRTDTSLCLLLRRDD